MPVLWGFWRTLTRILTANKCKSQMKRKILFFFVRIIFRFLLTTNLTRINESTREESTDLSEKEK